MTDSTGKTGRGITFEVGNGASPEVFTKIANVKGISFSGRDAAEIDFTTLDSLGGYRDLRQGFKDPGSVSLDLHFDPTDTTHIGIMTKFDSGENFNWRINYSAAGWDVAEQGNGFVKNPGDVKIDPDNPVGGTAVVRVRGSTEFVDLD